ncbi:MAG: YggU family protein [Myxococcales bacterium]|nr:YggU family protein [Myxococcales bacterium]
MTVTVDILVQPRASRAKIGPMHDGRIKIAVTAPPVDGEANAAVIELFAKQLGIARGDIEVVAGASSRRKTLRIAHVTAQQIAELVT